MENKARSKSGFQSHHEVDLYMSDWDLWYRNIFHDWNLKDGGRKVDKKIDGWKGLDEAPRREEVKRLPLPFSLFFLFCHSFFLIYSPLGRGRVSCGRNSTSGTWDQSSMIPCAEPKARGRWTVDKENLLNWQYMAWIRLQFYPLFIRWLMSITQVKVGRVKSHLIVDIPCT